MISQFIRKFKPSYELYNLFKRSELEHNLAKYKKYGINKKYYSSVSSSDFIGLESPQNIHDRLNSRDTLPSRSTFQNLSTQRQAELLPWSENGYVILKGFFSPDRVAQINKEVSELDRSKKARWVGNKMMFAIHYSDIILNASADPELMQIINLLMGKKMELFQSINFLTGSEQRTHSDSFHMSTFPYGNIIAAWIALETTTDQNGPLHYYEGSHKLPYLVNRDFDNAGSSLFLGDKKYSDYEDKISTVLEKHNFERKTLLAAPGDVLLWHSNLLHGGEPHHDKSMTRKSLVTHYYAEDAICYHEVTQRPTLKRKLDFPEL